MQIYSTREAKNNNTKKKEALPNQTQEIVF